MRSLQFAIVVLLASACGPRVKPRDHIRFHHGPHLAEGMDCLRCHARAAPTDGGMPQAAEGRPLLPAQADCLTCHDDPARDRCSRCHTEPQRAETYGDREDDIRFDHAQHEDAEIGNCVSCHGEATGSVETFEPTRPSMDRCTDSCHREDMRALRCFGCHSDLHRYRIQDVTMIQHPPGFVRRHGVEARVDSSLCTQCHEPSFCEQCHQNSPGAPLEAWMPSAAYRDFVHRGNFIARHGVEADLARGTCARCHGISFCDGCHQASGIGGGVAPGSPHPPGWLDPMSPFGHAQAARQDLLSCVSCHEADAETLCTPCHRVGGVAGNPHPPGFGAGMDPQRLGVCRACHTP